MDLLLPGNPGCSLKLSAFAAISSVLSGEWPPEQERDIFGFLWSTRWRILVLEEERGVRRQCKNGGRRCITSYLSF
jgi:hypothetical protein